MAAKTMWKPSDIAIWERAANKSVMAQTRMRTLATIPQKDIAFQGNINHGYLCDRHGAPPVWIRGDCSCPDMAYGAGRLEGKKVKTAFRCD
jgi:hypothetical protein